MSLVSAAFEPFVGKLAESVEKKLSRSRKKKDLLISRESILNNPEPLFGKDRCRKENGFRRDLYIPRLANGDVDGGLDEFWMFRKSTRENLVVISGKYASGKTRAVWEFIRRHEDIKSIFIPNRDDEGKSLNKDVNELVLEVGLVAKSFPLIILDDIDRFWRNTSHFKEPRDLAPLLSAINERDLPCLITISRDVPMLDDFFMMIRGDEAKGSETITNVRELTIKDIRQGDEVHRWCVANFKAPHYAKVIGGYIPDLNRYFTESARGISAQPSAHLFLLSHLILSKYRRTHCADFNKLNALYGALKTAENLRLPALQGIHDPELDVLFSSGLFRKEQDSIQIDDMGLYNHIKETWRTPNCPDALARQYLAETREAEWKQVLLLFSMDPDDPVIYSRALAKCEYPEHLEAISARFIRHFFVAKDDGGHVIPVKMGTAFQEAGEDLQREIRHTIGIILGRVSSPEVLCRQFIQAGVTPDITFINELLRQVILHKGHDTEQLLDYALGLKEEYRLEDDLYFLLQKERLDKKYDPDRIREALRLRQDLQERLQDESATDRLDYLEKTFSQYGRCLATKADSEKGMDDYFDLLEQFGEDGLTTGKGALRALIDRIGKKPDEWSASLFIQLARHLLTDSLVAEDDRDSALLQIVAQCPSAGTGIKIYRQAEKKAAALQADTRRKKAAWNAAGLLNILALRLAPKMVSSSLEETNEIEAILEGRIRQCQGQNLGAARKMFNALLGNSPSGWTDAPTESIDGLVLRFKDTDLFSGDREIDSINSLFGAVLRILPEWKTLKTETELSACYRRFAEEIYGLLEEYGIQADDEFHVHLFTAMDEMLKLDPSTDVSSLRKLIPDAFDNELLLCQAVKCAGSPDEVIGIARQCELNARGGVLRVDLVNHLIESACSRFRGNRELEGILQCLVEGDDDSFEGLERAITHDVFDYSHYLKYHAQIGNNIKTPEEVRSYVESSWEKLRHVGNPLRENKGDLLCTAIGLDLMSMDDALDLVEWAMTLRPADSIITKHSVITLARKYKKAGEDSPSQIGRIQKIINNLADKGIHFQIGDMRMITHCFPPRHIWVPVTRESKP